MHWPAMVGSPTLPDGLADGEFAFFCLTDNVTCCKPLDQTGLRSKSRPVYIFN